MQGQTERSGTCLLGEYKAQRDLIHVDKYCKRESKGDEARVFFMPNDRTRGNAHKLKYRKFCLNTQPAFFFFFVPQDWSVTGSGCQRVCWVPIIGDIKNQTVQEPAVDDSTQIREIGLDDFQRCLQTSHVLWWCPNLLFSSSAVTHFFPQPTFSIFTSQQGTVVISSCRHKPKFLCPN